MMTDIDNPIVDEFTLRKDLYLLMSLLLADSEMKKVPNAISWTKSFHESEVQKLMLWVATAMRARLDLLQSKNERPFHGQFCGEYWADFKKSGSEDLTFRRACNSVIHAKEVLTYKVPPQEQEEVTSHVYSDRITVRGTRRGKTTRAQIDIVRFVQISDNLIDHLRR